MNGEPHATSWEAGEGLVLIVEDDLDIAETLAAVLEDRGYRVETAANGVAALARLHRSPRPELILLDLAMPLMDGREFRRAQLAEPELASTPVVVLTAGARAPEPELAPMAWLFKPVSLDDLLRVVARYAPRRCL
jgi:CheY-like chemotaxis protein